MGSRGGLGGHHLQREERARDSVWKENCVKGLLNRKHYCNSVCLPFNAFQ